MDTLALINSAVNFVLYCSMSRQFRDTFKRLFCRNGWVANATQGKCCASGRSARSHHHHDHEAGFDIEIGPEPATLGPRGRRDSQPTGLVTTNDVTLHTTCL